VIYESGSNIGIGTTSPLQALHVNGALYLTSNPSNPGNTTSASFWNQAGLGATISGGQFQVQVNGTTPAMTINSNGNVGIGVTTASQALQVNGALYLTSNPSNPGNTTSASFWNQAGLGATISGGQFQVQVSGTTPAMTINSNGNVGMGTTSPYQQLHVTGSSTGGIAALIANTNTAVGSSATLGFGLWGASGSGSGSNNFAATVSAISENASNGNTDLAFSTYTGVATTPNYTLVERMRIAADGYIGIGTTTPNAQLDVRGNIYGGAVLALTNGSGSNGGYVYMCPSGNTSNTGYINFNTYTGSRTGYLGYGDSNYLYMTLDTAHTWYFNNMNAPLVNTYQLQTCLWSPNIYVSSSSTFTSSTVISGGSSTFFSGYNYMPMGSNWWSYNNNQNWTPAGTAGQICNRWYPPYSGIWACSYTMPLTNSATLFISSSMNGGSNAGGGNDLGVSQTIVAQQFSANVTQDIHVHWTGYVTTGNWLCFGFYMSSGGGTPASAGSNLTMALIQRTA
jgi:hypothetical protein